jgi:nitrogen fixation protein NifB
LPGGQVVSATPTTPPPAGPRLGVWHLRLAAAPHPLLLRRDRPFDEAAPSIGVADVLRYAAGARATLRGPLALEIEGPGDPLASPETVLRALSLLHDHHPDILTGLVIDGPLLTEYAEDLADFGLRYLVLKMDAVHLRTMKRLVEGALYRGERLDREAAAALTLEAGGQALRIAARHDIPTIVRVTLIPTVNAPEVEEIAVVARDAGAWRLDVVPHVPVSDGPLARAGAPTAGELRAARDAAEDVFEDVAPCRADDETLAWLTAERLQTVDTDALDALDVLRGLPPAEKDLEAAALLPPRRAQLVAVATQDGTLVDTPLTAAHLLRIYAVTQGTIRLLGSRPLPLDPRRRHDGVGSAQAFLQAVVGCRALVATHIPQRAATLLDAVGVRPVALGGAVDEVLDRVARGTIRHAHGSGSGS